MGRAVRMNKWHSKITIIFLTILLSAFLMIACSDSDGDNDGGETSTPTSVTMTEVFPLSSGWVTDNWTLFVDQKDHEINGVTTRAMVNTRDLVVYYWTNDETGLLLHAVTDLKEYGLTYIPDSPIKIANAVMETGDKVEGSYEVEIPGEETGEFELESRNYSVELVDIEAVNVQAGSFEVCGKFEMKQWYSDFSSVSAPVETFWLCDGVGFVKGVNDPLPVDDTNITSFELFNENGESRELISYHLTPDLEDPEVAAVKEKWNEDILLFEQENLTSISEGMHDEYYDRSCRDKETALEDWEYFYNQVDDYVGFGTVEEVTFSEDGTMAFVMREYLDSFWWHGDGPDGIRDHFWSRRISKYSKIDGVWLSYGAHADISPERGWAFVYVRKVPDEDPYLAINTGLYDCESGDYIDSLGKVTSYTVTGPPGSGINAYDLRPQLDPAWREFFTQFPLSEISNPSGFYTFDLTDQELDNYIFTRYFGKPIVLPEPDLNDLEYGDTSLTFSWEWDPGYLDLDLEKIRYRIELYDQDGGRVWSQYVNDFYTKTYTAELADLNLPGGTYSWRIRVRYYGKYGDYSQMISETRTPTVEFGI